MNILFSFENLIDIFQNRLVRKWGRFAIIAGVLLVSSLLSLLVSNSTILLIILAGIAGIIGLTIILQYPSLIFLIILVSGFSIPYTGPGGINFAVIGIVAGLALWIMDMFIRQRRLFLVPTRMNLPIFVFITSAVISLISGQVDWYPTMEQASLTAQLGGFSVFILSAAVFLLVGNLIKHEGWLKALCLYLLFMGAIYMFARVFPSFSPYVRRFFQTGATTGSLFWVWMVVIPYSQALLNTKLPKIIRAGLFIFTIIVLLIAVFQASGWKSGYIPPLAGVAVITALWLKKKVWYFVPFVPVAAWYIMANAITSDQYSTISRLEAWKIVFQLSIINPLFGLGFANYYWYTPIIPINGWYVNFNSHSQYIDVIAQTGFVGLFCFFWVLWAIGKLGWDLRDKVEEGFPKAYVFGALGGLAGSVVAGFFVDWFLPFTYNIGLYGFRASMLSWIFMGGLVFFEQNLHQRADPTKSDENDLLIQGGVHE